MAYVVGDYVNNGRYLIPTYDQMLLEKDTYTIKNLQEKLDNLRKQNDEQKTKITNLERRVAVPPPPPPPPPRGSTVNADVHRRLGEQLRLSQDALRELERTSRAATTAAATAATATQRNAVNSAVINALRQISSKFTDEQKVPMEAVINSDDTPDEKMNQVGNLIIGIRDDLQSQLNAANQRITELSATITEISGERDTAKAQLEANAVTIAGLEAQLVAATSAKEEAVGLVDIVSTDLTKEKIQNIKSVLERISNKFPPSETKNLLNAKNNEIIVQSPQQQDFNNKIIEFVEIIGNYIQDLNNQLTANAVTITDLEGTNAKLEDQLAAANTDNAAAVQQLTTVQEAKEQIQVRVDQEKAEKQKYRNLLKQALNKINSIEQNIAAQKDIIETFMLGRPEFQTGGADPQVTEEQIDAVGNRLKELETIIVRNNVKIQRIIAAYDTAYTPLNAENRALQQQNELLEARNVGLGEENAQLQQKKNKLETKIVSISTVIQRLKTRFSNDFHFIDMNSIRPKVEILNNLVSSFQSNLQFGEFKNNIKEAYTQIKEIIGDLKELLKIKVQSLNTIRRNSNRDIDEIETTITQDGGKLRRHSKKQRGGAAAAAEPSVLRLLEDIMDRLIDYINRYQLPVGEPVVDPLVPDDVFYRFGEKIFTALNLHYPGVRKRSQIKKLAKDMCNRLYEAGDQGNTGNSCSQPNATKNDTKPYSVYLPKLQEYLNEKLSRNNKFNEEDQKLFVLLITILSPRQKASVATLPGGSPEEGKPVYRRVINALTILKDMMKNYQEGNINNVTSFILGKQQEVMVERNQSNNGPKYTLQRGGYQGFNF